MLIAVSSRLQVDRLFDHAAKWMVVGVGGLVAVMGGYYFLSGPEPVAPLALSAAAPVAAKPKEHYAAIGSGPLALRSNSASHFMAQIASEIVLVGRNTRPDARAKEGGILLALRKSGQEKIVFPGETLFLKMDEKMSFSLEPTKLSICPKLSDQKGVDLEIALQKEEGEERARFVLQEDMNAAREREIPGFLALKEGKWWGNDALVQQYGGEEYKALREKQKIEFADGKSASVCFVGQGDYLTWDGEGWCVATFDKVSPDAPLAYVRSLGGKGIEIEGWDQTGFHSIKVKLNPQAPGGFKEKAETLIASPKMRSATQVSCLMGKRRMILKHGDWVVKTPSGWHHLRTAKEIDDCLLHKVRGELLIVDAIEKEQGKMIVKGHLFDEMHLQTQLVTIPVTSDKKGAQSQRKKKSIFHKSQAKERKA